MTDLLFVYGTLRNQEANHFYLDEAELITEQAWTKGRLYTSPSYYPVLKDEEAVVYGELYGINEEILKKVDELEGFVVGGESNLYDREIRTIHTETGEKEAFVYYLSSRNDELAGKEIEHGDWRLHQLLLEDDLYYFAYGSCMDDERFRLAGVEGYFQEKVGRGVLKGYGLQFSFHVHDGGRADIIEAEGSEVEGILYKVPMGAIDYLFQREGVHTDSYRPTVVSVAHSDGVLPNVLTFYVKDKQPDKAPPLHYAREIHRGGLPHLSEAYITMLEKRFTETFKVEGFEKYLSQANREQTGEDK
ncbi:gamma-glutamylcyclotransferase [Thalassobacillus hwangdonensis]|uniref:Gamma-glutamylcyclotransferase n=1 Tax=Thalassobacillus hwangdonensis TaxID=546108 RepID=A0ABW3KZ87_9BACI